MTSESFANARPAWQQSTLPLVVTHYGEFTGYNVKNFRKLIGKDVIVAHQLLKNDIEEHEYWLVTKDLTHDSSPQGFAKWMKWDSSAKQTETGEIPFHYTQLTALKNAIPPEPELQLVLPKKKKMFSITREYNVDIITLFHASGDFNYRSSWQEGVQKVEELGHFLPRVGTKGRMILDSGETVMYASSYSYSDDRIEFSETDEKKKNAYYFILEKFDEQNTRLTVEYYIGANLLNELQFRWFKKKKMEASLQRSLERLDAVAKSIHLPDRA